MQSKRASGKLSEVYDYTGTSGGGMTIYKYSMSFTAGSLFCQESLMIAELFLDFRDWNVVRKKVLSENLLQTRTLNTLKRVYREISSRLKTLCEEELILMVKGTPQDQNQLLWLSVCRRYEFISDFAKEVLRERFIAFKSVLQYEDFDVFFNQKAEWHDELDRIAHATRIKVRQIIFKMMREAGLLTDSHIINPVVLSAQFLQAIPRRQREDLLVFPVFQADLCRWA